MDPRSSNRQKTTTGNSKGVHRRGDNLGTGPVGRQDGYSGRRPGASGGPSVRPSSGGGMGGKRAAAVGGGSTGLIIIVIIIMLLFKGGGGSGVGSGTSTYDQTGALTGQTSSSTSGIGTGTGNSSGGSSAISLGDVTSLFGGFAGAATTSGWQNGLNNTGKLNKEVASGSREKFTSIVGNGQDVYTVMVYMCGTDLESRSGMASSDLGEMAAATIPDNLNIIVYTGGCNGWKTSGISNSTNQIYRVRSGKLEQLVADDGDKVMTDPKTLEHFINYCAQNYPADRQSLIFWDHGGGSITGYGYDEKHKSAGSMDLAEINSALKATGQKFDFIGFDACLMATLETTYMCSNYADYLIASEETEPGVGWYHTKWVNALGQNTSMPTIELGQVIVDGFVDECNRVCRGQKTTLSVIDLAEFMNTVPAKLSAFAKDSSNLMKNGEYQTVSDARAGTREFATSSKIDQVDLVNFANTIGSDSAKELSDAILAAVKYNRTSSSMTNAYGVSFYWPQKKASAVNTVAAINSNVGLDDEYNNCLKTFAGMQTTGQAAAGGGSSALGSLFGMSSGSGTTTGGGDISSLMNLFLGGGKSIPGLDSGDVDFMNDTEVYNVEDASNYVADHQFNPSALVWDLTEDGYHMIDVPVDQWKLIQNLQVNMFVDDGEGYVDLGLDNLYAFTEDGKLIGDTDNTWFSIDYQPVAFYYEDTTETEDGNTIVQGRVPAFVDGVRCNLIIIFDNENPNGYIAGARYDYSDEVEDPSDMTVAKGVTEIEEGAAIDFICDYYSYDQTYIGSYYLGEQISYADDLVLSYEDVQSKSMITYVLTDIYGTEYWTPAIAQGE